MFQQIDSYEQYRNIVKGKILINNSYNLTQIKKFVRDKKLCGYITGDMAFLLYDEGTFYQLTIAKTKNSEFVFPLEWKENWRDKPIVCFVVENRNKYTELREFLQQQGMAYRCKSREYVCEKIVGIKSSQKELNVLTEVENRKQYQQIINLWKNSLPLVEVPEMIAKDLKLLEEKKQLFYIKDNLDNVVAACYFDYLLGTSTIHHLCVDEKYRRKGYSSRLLEEWIERLSGLHARKARAWIEEDNLASQSSFEKKGFCLSGAVSYQYVLENGGIIDG